MIRDWCTALGRVSRVRSAPVTYGLIALCFLLFVVGPASGLNPAYGTGDALLAAQRACFRRWGVVPAELFTSPRSVLTPATALFVHGSWLHLLGNMLFLHVFGRSVSARCGSPCSTWAADTWPCWATRWRTAPRSSR
jgi:membrane associated rhomboid family serine protease